jgi:hypothetical protein
MSQEPADVRPPASPLLANPPEYRNTSGESHDFQMLWRSRFATERDPACGSEPVLVMTRAGDTDADLLSLHLASRNIPMYRINSDNLPQQEAVLQLGSGVVRIDGTAFSPRSLWVRYFDTAAMPRTGHDDYDRLAQDAWTEFLYALADSFPQATINRGYIASRHQKMAQLSAAERCGFRVPATELRTLDVGRGCGRTLLKAPGSHFVEATPGRRRLLSPVLVEAGGAQCAIPVLVQPLLEFDVEIRVYVIGHAIKAFSVPPRGGWDGAERREEIKEVDLPPETRRSLRYLMDRLELEVAAVDLLRVGHDFYFLEANATFDWSWCERPTGSKAVTQALIELLTREGAE